MSNQTSGEGASRPAMVFCRHCGKGMHVTAANCPGCGGMQRTANEPAASAGGGIWMSITSLVIGIVCALALFDDSAWDRDTVGGALLIAAVSIVLGGISLNQRKPGKGMAIAGIVMSGVGALIALGKFPG